MMMNLTTELLLLFIGLLLATLQGIVLMRWKNVDNRLDENATAMSNFANAFVREVAELRVLFAAFDRDEFGRHRHRITNLEIEQGRIKQEVAAVKSRCALLHDHHHDEGHG